MRSFDWLKKLLKFEEKMRSLKKNWSLQGLNRGHDSVARQESFKSELATAGAVIHPITYVNSVKYILKRIFEFRKTRAACIVFSNLPTAMDCSFRDEITRCKHES